MRAPVLKNPFSRNRAPKIKVLVMGHSHTHCITVAANKRGLTTLKSINLNSSKKGAGRLVAEYKSVPFVVLSIAGNQHNTLSMVEHAQKFSVFGNDANVTVDAGRILIPQAVMDAVLADLLKNSFKSMENLVAQFSNSKVALLAPPPPKSDWEMIRQNPSSFADVIGAGPAPLACKIALYDMQMRQLRALADALGVGVIEVPAECIDAQGFLKPKFSAQDPTHGNENLGRRLIDEIAMKFEVAL